MKYRYHLKIERYYKYTYKDIDEAIVKGHRNIYFYKQKIYDIIKIQRSYEQIRKRRIRISATERQYKFKKR